MFITKVMEKFANLATGNLATLLSDGFEIAPLRCPVSENILVDTRDGKTTRVPVLKSGTRVVNYYPGTRLK